MLPRSYRRSALPLMRLLHLGLVLVIALVSAVPALAGSLSRPLPSAAPTTPSSASMTWLDRAPSPVSVVVFGYVALNGYIYLIGGDIAGTSTSAFAKPTGKRAARTSGQIRLVIFHAWRVPGLAVASPPSDDLVLVRESLRVSRKVGKHGLPVLVRVRWRGGLHPHCCSRADAFRQASLPAVRS